MNAETRYIAPKGIDAIVNRIFNLLPKLGISVLGSRLLAVRGRKSGEWRTTMVNLLIDTDGARYLVAPRGHTQWVRNLRVAGGGELRLGRKVETFTATEVPDADKVPLLRLYLRKWGWEVGAFFEGITKDATDEQLAEIAPGFPVFRLA
ncbi:nitroreductase family deazaflavin-dependent oxidoreductase [Nocardia bovistercoris]|uniref:Nitroreductase family deazaflavin-dependent oxidoreductase n=1 Tax=Nocardia bovistercoris TaxID=2785916 RepID=A0A931IEL4_9NOCA|nr:nitroreductase family deazaflavin-dependent oxidoreductase [Nocardia bovistercoris]MBH0778682.1 nitroreductase family deazaflavin-dependent oxidoreductase [Nocardia bovistercoris]